MTDPTDKPTTEQMLAWVSEAWMEFRDDETAEIYDAQVEIKDAIRSRLADYDTEKARHAETLKVLVAVTEERDALVELRQEILDMGGTAYLKALKAEVERLQSLLKYPDPEDMPAELATKFCPFKDPLHFHHDGCPSEWAVEARAEKAEAAYKDACDEVAMAKADLSGAEAALLESESKYRLLSAIYEKTEAELALAKPLLEVILSHEYGGGTEIVWHGHIIKAADAYRAAREKKEEKG